MNNGTANQSVVSGISDMSQSFAALKQAEQKEPNQQNQIQYDENNMRFVIRGHRVNNIACVFTYGSRRA